MTNPPIKLGKLENNVMSLYDDEDKKFDFPNPTVINISSNFIMIDWKGSGPSGPWGRYLSDNFGGVETDLGVLMSGIFKFK